MICGEVILCWAKENESVWQATWEEEVGAAGLGTVYSLYWKCTLWKKIDRGIGYHCLSTRTDDHVFFCLKIHQYPLPRMFSQCLLVHIRQILHLFCWMFLYSETFFPCGPCWDLICYYLEPWGEMRSNLEDSKHHLLWSLVMEKLLPSKGKRLLLSIQRV